MESPLVVRDLRSQLFAERNQDAPVVVVIDGEMRCVTGVVDSESGLVVRLETATIVQLLEDLA